MKQLVPVLLLICPLLLSAFGLELSQLTIREEATVWSDRIELKDLVTDSRNLPDEIASLLIGAAPRPGKSELFSIAEIRKKLSANHINVSRLDGSQQIRVHRVGREIEPGRFLPQIKAYISARIPGDERLHVEVTSTQPIAVPRELTWRIHPAKGQDFIGSILFSLEGIQPDSGHVVLQRWINVRVSREALMAVSSRSFRSGEEITEADIHFEWRVMSPSTLNAFTQNDSPAGRRAERQIPANQIITPAFIRQDYLVQRGSSATLIARSNGVSASTPVQVLENGIKNQWVLIQNPRSSRNFRARVSGKNQLEVIIE